MAAGGDQGSAEEAQRAAERRAFAAAHQGHEKQHLAMFLIFVAVLAMLPATVRYWRLRHALSYKLVSVGSICMLPPYFALGNGYVRFLAVWIGYMGVSTYVLFLATREPLYPRAPRRVYQWVALINKASYAVSTAGVVLFAFCLFNAIPGATDSEFVVESSLMTLFYGLYFGLLSRDLVSLCSDRMAATLGYGGGGGGLPTKALAPGVCCICSGVLGSADGVLGSTGDAPVPVEPTHVLGCGHEFHAICIRGWCVVGKKDSCPFCREKVDLETLKQNPWDRHELLYVTALEYMRFFVSWQPMTLLLLAGVFWATGLD
ncbi:hypothetical protein LPJ61_001421 [Coemansia biformis]|uniref:RING-type domain-containing protein n=1 Tax=Coemansia biformis TaxID=1286918 RepID=A0A9W7YG05_9FUNG|nr:hypothetical protein LPJ61_001421 [Coemansia biformis]